MSRPQRPLSQLLRTLPQELFERIYHATFTAPPTVIYIVEPFPPPHLLEVSRDSRSLFARSYYSSTAFAFDAPATLTKWLRCFTPTHRSMLETIVIVRWESPIAWPRAERDLKSDFAKWHGQDLADKIIFVDPDEVDYSFESSSWMLLTYSW